MTILELEKMAAQVRRDILRMVHGCQSGHPGGSLGCADFLTAMYFNVLKHNAKAFNMSGANEDVFLLSNGHISPVWYSVLARSGYFPIAEMATFRKLNTRLQGHPTTAEHLEGIRIASGSLGQGMSAAIGIASAKKMNKETELVYCLMGDGEQQEGQVWEAAMYAAHNKVDNLIGIIDYNGRQIDGDVIDVLTLGNLAHKYEAFGWDVLEMNGNDMAEVLTKMAEAKALTHKGKPVMILMRTEMGAGVDFMMGTHKWHGVAPNDTQLADALAQLELTTDY